MNRTRLFEIIEKGKQSDKWSISYDCFMFLTIAASLVPLMFVEDHMAFRYMESVTVTIFIVDYLLRWSTADLKLVKKGKAFQDFADFQVPAIFQ